MKAVTGWLAMAVLVAGVIAIVFTTKGTAPQAGHGSPGPPRSPAASPPDRVLSSTATEPGGTITVYVRYQPAADGRLTLRAVRAAFGSRVGYPVPFFAFVLRARTGAALARFSSPADQASRVTSDDTGWIRLAGRRYAALPPGATMTVTLQAATSTRAPGKPFPALVTGLILTPRRALGRQ